MKSDDVSAAAQLLARLGVTVDELADGVKRSAPTFAEYIEHLRAALPETTVRNYTPYWRVLERRWPDRQLDSPTATEIDRLVKEHRCRAVVRSNSRGGRGAAANMVSAIRCIYRHAEADRLIHPADNPATRVAKPRRLPSTRHALTFDQVREIGHVASTTGNDRELDALIVRLHVETACRTGGALALTVDDLNVDDCLVKFCEKGETERWQPVSPLLMSRLVEHVERRGGRRATRQVLRYRSGRPVGRRRYDYLIKRIREQLPWAASMQISAHWIRHTTLTFVEREFGYAVARAYAGHIEPTRMDGATYSYVRASLPEVAEALAAVSGQPHPLARANRRGLGA
ncbi:tyrosine-type recombinase/integrase [Nocardia huaxiensis]|uniref:tyrosine-type recombinase/integrase n=1 Tax=Nocardia huaxiensis TaxID=2755382 RepID=UPI001C681135|nr:site-specific integrase [Nocardia huaxiensis]